MMHGQTNVNKIAIHICKVSPIYIGVSHRTTSTAVAASLCRPVQKDRQYLSSVCSPTLQILNVTLKTVSSRSTLLSNFHGSRHCHCRSRHMYTAKFHTSLYTFQRAAHFQKLTPLEPIVSSPLMKSKENIPNYNHKYETFLDLFISTDALHVSGGSSAHHQEHKTVHTASGIVNQCCCCAAVLIDNT